MFSQTIATKYEQQFYCKSWVFINDYGINKECNENLVNTNKI